MGRHVKTPTPHGGTETLLEKIAIAACRIAALIVVFAVVAVLMASIWYNTADTHYSVAIDSASALDQKTGVSFNLTLGIASRSYGAAACIDPSMIVEVFYRDVRVAAGKVAGQPATCAMPRSVAELPVVARATRVRAGGVMDNLAAEMGRGAAVFGVKLRSPDGTSCDGRNNWAAWWVLDCEETQVGDDAVPCESETYTEELIK